MNLIKIKLHSAIPENYSGICEYSNGDKAWYLNGQLHRDDGPAFESIYGDKHWHLNGKLHRVDGPAVEYPNGIKYWLLNDVYYSQEEWFERLSDEDKLEAIWNLR
jgi:hypothetical protein